MTHVNKPELSKGRSIRPWLLIPKIIGVMIYVGGVATVLGLWLASDFTSMDITDPRRQLVLHQVSRLMVFLVVPALILALLMGTALLLQQPKVFLRTRWWQIKFLALAIVIPAAHFYCRAKFTILKETTSKATSDAVASQFTMGLTAALIGSIGVVVLSRLKPRLGQKTTSSPLSQSSQTSISAGDR